MKNEGTDNADTRHFDLPLCPMSVVYESCLARLSSRGFRANVPGIKAIPSARRMPRREMSQRPEEAMVRQLQTASSWRSERYAVCVKMDAGMWNAVEVVLNCKGSSWTCK